MFERRAVERARFLERLDRRSGLAEIHLHSA